MFFALQTFETPAVWGRNYKVRPQAHFFNGRPPLSTWVDTDVTFNSPRPPLPFLHTASDQKLDGGKVWEQGYWITSCLNSVNTVPQLTLPGNRNILVVQSSYTFSPGR